MNQLQVCDVHGVLNQQFKSLFDNISCKYKSKYFVQGLLLLEDHFGTLQGRLQKIKKIVREGRR